MSRKKVIEELRENALIPIEEQPYKVPENWIWTTFGNVAKLYNGFAFKSSDYQAEGIPVIRISDISRSNTTPDRAVRVPDHLYNERFLIKKGDLLIAMSGATTGKTGIYSSEAIALQNQRVGNIKEIDDQVLTPEFKNLFVLTNSEEILKKAYGGAQPNISGALIEQLKIPLPPLNEQKRITQKVEFLTEKLRNAKQAIAWIKNTSEHRSAAILNKAFSGDLLSRSLPKKVVTINSQVTLDIPVHWEVKPLAEVVDNYNNLRIPVSQKKRKEMHGQIPYYGATGIVDYINGHTHEGEYICIGEDGANLLSRTKPQAFMINGKAWVNNHAHVVKMKEEMCNQFLLQYINFIPLNDYVTGTAQPKLNRKNLDSILIILPPRSEQIALSKKVETLLLKEKKILHVCESLLQEISMMEKSIMVKALQGGLGTNDVNDEHALKLLNTILQK